MPWKPYYPVVSSCALRLFSECRRCFYLDRRLKIKRPNTSTFALQNVIDSLMKKEFDMYRARGEAHPLMRALPGDLVPFADERIERWRNLEAGGIKSAHSPTGLTALALVDDVWLSREDGSLRIVDYKTHGSVRSFHLKSGWGTTYQRQLEFYAFALMNSGEVDMPISSTAHLVVVSPDRTAAEFGDVLQFDAELFTHACDITWIDDELADVLACLESDEPPGANDDCMFCRYLSEVTAIG